MCSCVFFREVFATLLLFLLLLQFLRCILHERCLVFCALFPLSNSLLFLLAGGNENFLALRVFGLLFGLVLVPGCDHFGTGPGLDESTPVSSERTPSTCPIKI